MAKTIGVTQARVGSSRLPKKVLLQIQEKTLLEYHLERIKQSKLVNNWIVATTNEDESDAICDIATKVDLHCYKGSLNDVLDRFYQTVKDEKPDYVVRVTSDCPLIDAGLIDETVQFCISNKLAYFSNVFLEKYPDGLDVEVFSFKLLEEAWQKASLKTDREHVTPYMRRKVDLSQHSNNTIDAKYSKIRITVDEALDFNVIEHLIENLGSNQSWKIYADYILNNPRIGEINGSLNRNQGYMKSKFEEIELRNITNFVISDEYRKTIHQYIPGGCHTYSKGDDQFPILSPAAIVKGKGAYVWDVDGNQFLDCSMGLTSVSLGHAYDSVVNDVKAELDNGVNFQRPSHLEKEIAAKFLDLVPGHDMIKFSKNGSIVTTAAVKLARAFTGRKLVAFPGDHPFYSYDDWFIGKTACNKGVPEEISDLSVTFKGCSIQSLKELFDKYPNQIACLITEPEKNQCANCTCENSNEEFLKQAIELCHTNGALFIADEMVTGFKTAFPGTITKYGIIPDMATWGKGIANGFSFCALTGKKDIMELGGITREGEEKVFLISTTHGGETHGLSAAIATIEVFKNNNVIEHNHELGKKLIAICNQLIVEKNVADYINIIPSVWMPVFVFKDPNKEACQGFRTLFLQEMIRRGILFQGSFVPCFSHTIEDIYYFAKAFNESIEVYKEALKEGYQGFLKGNPAKAVFRKVL